jgi:hypothetical protein
MGYFAEGAMIKQNLNFETAAGYEILAAAGKTILRPGGKAATEQLLKWAAFQPGETVLELASGLGVLALGPRQDGRQYSIDELWTFKILANRAGTAIYIAQLNMENTLKLRQKINALEERVKALESAD